jgi:uncharacterized protein
MSSLAVTCSLEHFTAILAELLITTPEGRHILDTMAPSHRTLWAWHAIEETEHKAVAYDVFCAIGGTYLLRIYSHIITTVLFIAMCLYLNLKFMWESGHILDFKGVGQLFYFLFVYPAFLTKLIPLWASYFRPSYHPWTSYSSEHNNMVIGAMEGWVREMNIETTQTTIPIKKTD